MKLIKSIIFFVVLIFVAVTLSACSSKQYYSKSEFLMGTVIKITCTDQQAIDAAFKEIKRVESILSKFKPESEVSKLNKEGTLKVGPDLLYVLKRAKELYRESDGAFDVTVAPLIDVWKTAIKNKNLPTNEEIEKAKNLVGFENVSIDEEKSIITFLKKGVTIDLGGIAKGYAVDQAIKKLREIGIKSCLIDAGGDVYCLGSKRGEPWQIGIQHPRKKGELIDIIRIKDRAVATSGDYEQMFVIDNKRYCHIINPKTGYPSESGIMAVTVIASYCINADALATSIFVLGEKKGMDLIHKQPNTEAFIYREDDLNVFDIF